MIFPKGRSPKTFALALVLINGFSDVARGAKTFHFLQETNSSTSVFRDQEGADEKPKCRDIISRNFPFVQRRAPATNSAIKGNRSARAGGATNAETPRVKRDGLSCYEQTNIFTL